MTDQPTADPIGDTTPETARALLWRHGLPEDVIDGALALFAQELAGKIRAHRDHTRGAVQATKVMDFAADLISPEHWARTVPAVPVSSPPPDQTAELERLRTENDRMRHELEVMYGGAFESLHPAPPSDRAALIAATARACAAHLRDRYSDTWTEDAARSLELNAARIERGEQTALLRRLAAEAQQPDTTPRPVQHAPGFAVLCSDCLAKGYAICMPDETLPPPQGPEYTPCECGHIEPEHEATEHAGNPYTGECMECDCGVYRPTPPAPLRRSEDDCPGFPERCPNLRPVDPNPPQHYGGIRCGCHDPQLPTHTGRNADDCPACQAQGLHSIGHPYECPGPETRP